MLKKLNKSKSEGFTIIEVMIVLAIAGLILLIVFLAVPALQRNSRNSQRKSDVGRIGTAATTIASNNNNNYTSITGGAAGSLATEAGTLGYYDSANIGAGPSSTASNLTNGTDKDHVFVVTDAKCSGVNAVVAKRQIAVFYATEGGGGDTKICVDQ